MQRPHLLTLLVVLGLGAVAGAWWFTRGEAEPPPDSTGATQTSAVEAAAVPTASPAPTTTTEERRSEAAVTAAMDVADDPEIRAAMTGFRGRVVDHARAPVARCGVRIYRGAVDSLLPAAVDWFAETSTLVPNYIAGEAKTADDGTFLIGGVWPRAFYILFAGIGTDAPSHRLLQHSPTPGEIVDLGDIVLNHAAVATGTVVDERGKPIAGALVRGVDLPGQLLSFVPVERFEPTGCVLVREAQSPIQVVELPAWVEPAFEHLPIPTTRSDAEGKFRLVGIVPGNNVIATTKTGMLADLKPTVRFEPGQEKDLGTIRLREGEEFSGRVVDTNGKPVAGAEVVAGSTISVVPFDFAVRLGKTDAEGRVTGTGFGAGKATMAARRSDKHPWVLAEPQPILNDIVVTLPATGTATVRVTFQGAIVREPKLKLLAGKRREEVMVMSVIGLGRSVDLASRTTHLEDGQIVISDLPVGRYVLLATSDAAAMECAELDLSSGTAQVAIELSPRIEYVVRVVGPEGAPVRNAAVYVEDRGDRRRSEMPLCAGRTGADGRLRIDQANSDKIRVSAEHPRWGTVHGATEQGQGELVLTMQAPGTIEGTVTDGGKPPSPGKYAIAIEQRTRGAPGAIEQVPGLVTPGLEGQFIQRAVQPGTYRVQTIPALDALTSPGSVMNFAQGMFMHDGNLPHEEIQVASGQTTTVALEVGKEQYTGPVGAVFGSVSVDGRLAAGYRLQAWTSAGRRVATVDAAGRFDFAAMPVGHVHLTLMSSDASVFNNRGVWNSSFELKAAESREIVIEIQTTSLRGYILRPDGTPAAGMHIQASGRPFANKADGDSDGTSWHGESADAEGRFAFTDVPAGTYDLRVQGEGSEALRGELRGLRAEGGRPLDGLRLQLRAALKVSGRVDLSVFAAKPEWVWVSVHRPDDKDPGNRDAARQVGGFGIQDDGTFETYDLESGRYFVNVHAQVTDSWQQYAVIDPMVVAESGASDVLLRPTLAKHN